MVVGCRVTDDLDPSVLAAVVALADALDGRRPPCSTDPEAWYAANLAPAIEACWHGCRGMTECGHLADVLDEKHGVWGGVERTRKRRGPAWTAPDLQPGVEVA
jgi:hypothetical protein